MRAARPTSRDATAATLPGAIPSDDREVAAFLAEVDRRLTPYLRRGLEEVPDVDPLKRGMTHQILGGGKRIRAALCVASCELFLQPCADVVDFAAAIEHVQNLTLVHDDIADGDPERRSHDSIWRVYGVPHAINIGDMFVPLAARAILRAPYADGLKLRLLDLLSQYGFMMIEGQTLDLNLRRNDAVCFDDYFSCTMKKTGALLAMATVGGAMIGGATDAQLDRLREFAMRAGVAFQIKDDLLDMNGGKGRTPGSDILEGKRTLMVVHATRRASAERRRRLYAILNQPREATSPQDVRWVWDVYRRTGADAYAEETAARLIEEASQHILNVPESEAKYRFLRLARYLTARSR